MHIKSLSFLDRQQIKDSLIFLYTNPEYLDKILLVKFKTKLYSYKYFNESKRREMNGYTIEWRSPRGALIATIQQNPFSKGTKNSIVASIKKYKVKHFNDVYASVKYIEDTLLNEGYILYRLNTYDHSLHMPQVLQSRLSLNYNVSKIKCALDLLHLSGFDRITRIYSPHNNKIAFDLHTILSESNIYLYTNNLFSSNRDLIAMTPIPKDSKILKEKTKFVKEKLFMLKSKLSLLQADWTLIDTRCKKKI